MNELEVISENGSRATRVGRPSKKEGGPMVKFTYYEEFLCELPDVDINRMNRMGLNEYRAYSAMGLCVVGLNTSVSAGPIQNNKVSLFAPFIQNVRDTHDPREQIQTVWIGHHTARYRRTTRRTVTTAARSSRKAERPRSGRFIGQVASRDQLRGQQAPKGLPPSAFLTGILRDAPRKPK